jgi:hypothetical protein
MIKLTIFLTTLFVASAFAASSVLADIINQENLKTHLRWNLVVPRDQFFVVKREQTLFIETVNLELFEKLAGEMAKIQVNGQYVDSIKYSKDNFPARPATIAVKLKDPSVELFSFYRDADKKYILDFWINNDVASNRPDTFKKPLPLPVSNEPLISKKKVPENKLLQQKSKILPILEVTKEIAETKLPDLNTKKVDSAMRIIEGTAKNMGITILD